MASRLALVIIAAASLAAASSVAAHATEAPAVTCTYTFTAWNGGFSADIAMANSGPTIDGWTVHWSFATPTQLKTAWSAVLTQPSQVEMVATPAPWNRVIRSGSVVTFGWTGVAAATEAPTDITVNGQRC